VYTFLDVEEKSIDDGTFAFCFFSVTHITWHHLPADRHSRGANLGYADGHTAYQRWKWPKVFRQYGQEPANRLDQADLSGLKSEPRIRNLKEGRIPKAETPSGRSIENAPPVLLNSFGSRG